MTLSAGSYVDVELALVGWTATNLSVRTVTELPATLPAEIVRVTRFGGGRPSLPFDVATIDVDCYAVGRQAAHDLAERVAHAWMYDLPGYRTGGGIVLAVDCVSAPSWTPYDNTNVRRNTATYRVRTHNPV